ncbi:Small-conductance mechanosensitive channel [Methylophaga thiooxydans]|uniref:Small-conductance mechanosensitive channel n=1 Tax=Methylophaga thiooxydans TaxID=392484 RepID=A0A0A0BIT6_9GAMM|nr:mechanosensitive ion channel family protein [Methylophaga thiooxydans]KGM07034.1 Small-conductance mechanosensitive channel [Methylophaga thiooxydans]
MMKLAFLLFSVLLSTVTQADVYSTAATISKNTTEQPQSIESSSQSGKLRSPQTTVKQFINAMTKVTTGDRDSLTLAVETLDLSAVSQLIRDERGEETARLLFTIIQLSDIPKIDDIPAETLKTSYVLLRSDEGNIVLKTNEQKNWLFSSKTVENVPDIFQALTDNHTIDTNGDSSVSLPASVQLRSQMPAFLKHGFILEYWQWLGLFFIIVLGSIADKVLAWVLKFNVARWQKNHPSFETLDSTVLRPLGLMAMALIWWSGLNMLGLPDTALLILLVAVKLLVSLSGIWSAFRVVDIFDALWTNKALRTSNKFDDLLVPMISKSLKVFVVVIGIVFAADNLNIDVTSLLAGLGLGGLAFALAAKDLLGNFFGSVTVLLDRPFSIGDWVVIGDIEGMVEEVGFRSTRVRTFYNSLVTMPNSILTTTKIDNMGARRYRRMKSMLAVTYDTPPERIEAFCEGIRKIIQMHPYMRKDMYQVYFNEYGAASLDILVYVFWATPDWNTELRERHRFLLDILRLARQLEIEFAYPTQTLYLKRGDVSAPSAQAFKPGMSQQDAFSRGQQEAEAIVSQTLGDEIPGPVEFPR